MINVNCDLLGAALGSDVLRACQRHAPTVAREADQVRGYQRHSSPRALLPWRVGRRVDDNLTHGSPAGVVGVAAGNEKPRQRLGDACCSWLGTVAVEMSKCGAHVATVVDGAGELTCGSPRLAWMIVDPFTVLAGNLRWLRLARRESWTILRCRVTMDPVTTTVITGANKGLGTQTVHEGTDAIVRLACLGPDGPTGTFTDHTGTVPW